MKTETVSLETPGGSMSAFVAHPDVAVSRAVLVFQEAFGVNDHIKDVTQRFASSGYLAIAPSVFHRSAGDEVFPYGNFDAIRPHMMALTATGIVEDADASLEWLRAQGVADGSIGVVGFCVGGYMTLLVAEERSLGAAVSFY